MLKQGIRRILEKVYQERGFDFREYKESSLERRIDRRLRARKAGSYQQYIGVLDKDPGEYENLLNDLTIKVTEFFRDAEAWHILRDKALPELIRAKAEIRNRTVSARRFPALPLRGALLRESAACPLGKSSAQWKPERCGKGAELRIWSAGCAAGQETYSIAILLDQLLGERRDEFEVDIWGTDIDKKSLLRARQAEYKPEMMKNVPQDLIDKYFDFVNNTFRVKSFIAKKIKFGFHDLVLNRSLKWMDIILCRNVAIYFDKPLQEKICMEFYKGLNQGGCLFLGKAETLIGSIQEKFKPVNKRWRIYQKEEVKGKS